VRRGDGRRNNGVIAVYGLEAGVHQMVHVPEHLVHLRVLQRVHAAQHAAVEGALGPAHVAVLLHAQLVQVLGVGELLPRRVGGRGERGGCGAEGAGRAVRLMVH